VNAEKGVPAMQMGPLRPSGSKVCFVQPSPTSVDEAGVNSPRYLLTPASWSSMKASVVRPKGHWVPSKTDAIRASPRTPTRRIFEYRERILLLLSSSG
jgi:hypothetical protein